MTFLPNGAWRSGLLWFENRVIDGHCVGAIICMGPVSFPMAAAALCANATIWNRDVFPVKFRHSGQIFAISSVTSFSAFVPNRMIWYFSVVSCFANSP